jgi:hypothetical protein
MNFNHVRIPSKDLVILHEGLLAFDKYFEENQ